MKDLISRENVAAVGKIAFAVAIGAYAYLYVSGPAPKR